MHVRKQLNTIGNKILNKKEGKKTVGRKREQEAI